MPQNDSKITLRSVFSWLIIPLIIGGVGFAHGSIWAHDKEIAILKTQQENLKESAQRTLEQADRRMERIENVLNEILKEMRNK